MITDRQGARRHAASTPSRSRASALRTAIAGSVVRTDAFDKEVRLQRRGSGRDLHQEAQTGFKVWAPTAAKVELVTYKSADPNAEDRSRPST
ncbi:MAG: hypothetical protein V9G11_03230 [Bifidobacterium adolescentis]